MDCFSNEIKSIPVVIKITVASKSRAVNVLTIGILGVVQTSTALDFGIKAIL